MSTSIHRSVILNWVGLAFRMGASFVLLPYIVARIGENGYGSYLVLVAAFGYSEILDFGLSAAIVRYVARMAATGEHERLNRILGAIFRFYFLLAALIVAAATLAWLFPQPWMRPQGAEPRFPFYIFLFGLLSASTFFQVGWKWILRGRERYDLSNVIDLAGLVVRVATILGLLHAGAGVLAVVMADLLESLVCWVGHWLVTRRLFPEIRPQWRHTQDEGLGEVRRYSVWVFFNQISDQVRFRTDSLVIAWARNTSDIALFGVAARLQSYLLQATNLMSVPFRSRLSYLDGAGDWDGVRALYLRGVRLVSFTGFALAGALFLHADPFMRAWMGPSFASSARILRILLPALAVEMSQIVSVVALYATGRHAMLAWLTLGEALTKLGLSLVLVRPLGIEGVALATAIPMLLNKGLLLSSYACRSLGVGVGRWLREGLSGPLLTLAISMLLDLGIDRVWRPVALPAVMLQLVVDLIPFALLGWWLVLREEDRIRARAMLGRLRRR
jgi:O-antigen/teichoic acid export membrane protein